MVSGVLGDNVACIKPANAGTDHPSLKEEDFPDGDLYSGELARDLTCKDPAGGKKYTPKSSNPPKAVCAAGLTQSAGYTIEGECEESNLDTKQH
jgi:hypothetical protein